MVDLYSAGWQVRKVRLVMLMSVAVALASCWWGWDLSQTYGLQPADGGQLAPLAARLAWGLGIAGLGIAFAVGMWLYGRNYIWAVGHDPASGLLYVRTLGMVGNILTSFPASSVLRSSYYEGSGRVRAPWYNIWVAGRRWPLILDAQGRFTDDRLARRLLKLRS